MERSPEPIGDAGTARSRSYQDIIGYVCSDGESIVSVSCGGGGYGVPEERDPELVAHNLSEGWITRERAERVYRVAFTLDGAVDRAKTEKLRSI
jgi:N-methylhydantoinase B